MQISTDRTYENRIAPQYITLPCYTLCCIIFFVIGLLPMLPYSLTQLFRPIFIASCFISSWHYFYRMGISSKMLIVYLSYMGIILLCYDLTNNAIVDYISMLLFGMFFILTAQRVWSKREILLILNVMILAGTFLACVLLIYNPNLISMESEANLNFFLSEKNRNTMAFSLVPASLCSAIMLFHNPRAFKSPKGLFYTASMLLCSFVVIATGARSAALSMMLGIVLVAFDWTRNSYYSKTRLFKTIVFLILVSATLWFIITLTAGTDSARIFNNLDDINGRESLWDFAWKLIDEKPTFGGGFDYWQNMGGDNLGTHNTFLTILVISGYTGAALFTLFLLSVFVELWSIRSFIPFAFIAELVFHTYSESSMDYYAYFPLVLAFILYSYMKRQNRNISSLFV